jgi:hypothetical protein
MQFSPAPYYFNPIRYKHFPQHPLHRHAHSIVISLISETKFHTHIKLRANLQVFTFSFPRFLDSRREEKTILN